MKSLLKNARNVKGLLTCEVANLLRIDQALISKFKSGKRIPTSEQIKALSHH
jgi:transcriptional regulator with XRE-family HTH domain